MRNHNEKTRDIADMVAARREADKVGPLLQWAERTVATNPKLAALPGADRVARFRKILPPGLIGEHAISHLWWILDDDITAFAATATPTIKRVVSDLHATLTGDPRR